MRKALDGFKFSPNSGLGPFGLATRCVAEEEKEIAMCTLPFGASDTSPLMLPVLSSATD